MARPWNYWDANGNQQQGWLGDDGHVYQDEDLTTPIGAGSRVQTDTGDIYQMGQNGVGQLWQSHSQHDEDGNWIPQGNQNFVNAQELMGQIQNRPGFTFDLNNNALYQMYKDQYQKLGQQAMEDTMGKAAGLTGGYGSTYGQNVGQQAYNDYLTRLNGQVPEIYAQERAAYDQQTQDLYNRWQMAMSAYNQDYQAGRDRLGDERYDAETAYAHAQDAQSLAYNQAMMLIQAGKTPSDELIAAAGLDPAFVSTMAALYAQQLAGYGGSGGGYSSGGGHSSGSGSSNNGGTGSGDLNTGVAEVETTQTAHGPAYYDILSYFGTGDFPENFAAYIRSAYLQGHLTKEEYDYIMAMYQHP